ncbi:hypothetical protein F4805DRAFT_460496 [Annulohypoxylon moriforme]|nr:hypothetical protein F4805DRAFT_460496 [Annulohypoxylon moriforme]
MRQSTLLAAALACCGAVIAAPPAMPPTITQAPAPDAVEFAAASSTPDCTKIQQYCSSCSSDDFNCETDPNCEWCRAHVWDSTTSSSTSTSTSTSTSSTSSSSA